MVTGKPRSGMTLSRYCCSMTSVTATSGGLFRSLGCTRMSDSIVVSINICLHADAAKPKHTAAAVAAAAAAPEAATAAVVAARPLVLPPVLQPSAQQ